MGSRESEAANWLHNKLGSTDDLWSGRSICSQLTRERLKDIVGCFRSLQPHVKVKLLLSLLHVKKRDVEEWKSDLEEIVDLATHDRDQWVATTGEILKTYPSSFLVNTKDLSGSTTFRSMHSDLKKIVKKSSESDILPVECMCLGKNALTSVVSHPPAPVKHFSLKRKPKSASLRADLLAKAQELQSSTKKGLPTGGVPMKVRSTAKRLDEELAIVKPPPFGSTSRNGGTTSGFLKADRPKSSTFTSVHRQSSTLAMRKEGGAKMLDISEMPPTSKEAKRRKKQEEQEAAAQAKKEKEEAAAAEKAAAAAKATPDYAAELGGNTAIKTVIPGTSRVNPNATSISYLPNVAPRPPVATMQGYDRDIGGLSSVTQPVGPADTLRHVVTGASPTNVIQRLRQPVGIVQSPAQAQMQPTLPQQQLPINHAAATSQNIVQQQPSNANPGAAPAVQQTQKKTLSLTKELMQQAQDMFRNSNAVTRPEKALILGFMAGSRENPCPQQGHIVNIRLNEGKEPVKLQDGSIREIIMETFFQMNYQTGDWKRIKKPKDPMSLLINVPPKVN